MGLFFASPEKCNANGLKSLEKGDFQAALKHFLKACKRGPEHGLYYYNAGVALLSLRAFFEAHDALRQSEDLGFPDAREYIDEIDWCSLIPEESAEEQHQSTSGFGALLGYVVGDEIGSMFGDFLESIVTGGSDNSTRIQGTIDDLEVLHSVQSDAGMGVQVGCQVRVDYLMWRTCSLRVYAYHHNGQPIINNNTQYATAEGHVSVSEYFVPPYHHSVYRNMHLLLPYTAFPEMHQEKGTQLSIQVYGPSNEVLCSNSSIMDFN